MYKVWSWSHGSLLAYWCAISSSTVCWIDYLFLHWTAFSSLSKVIWAFWYLFLAFLLCSVNCVSLFPLIPHSLDFCNYTISLEIIRMISSTLFLFFRIILVILTHLIFHINFRTVMSIATKNLSWIVRGIMLNYVKLVHHFQESWHLCYVAFYDQWIHNLSPFI